MDILQAKLVRLRRRLIAQRWVESVIGGVVVAAAVACGWLVVTRLFPTLGDPLPVTWALLALGTLGGSIQAYRRRPTLVQTALAADRRLGLRERLTSSLELAEADGPMIEALHRDARRHLEGVDLTSQFPWKTSKAMKWAYVPILAFGVGYLFLPEFDLLGAKEREAEAKAKAEAVHIQAQRLEQAVKPLAEAEEMAKANLDDLQGEIAKLAEDLKAQKITEKQALARLSDLSQELEKRMNTLQENAPLPKMMESLRQVNAESELGKAVQSGDFSKAAMEAKALKEKLESGTLSEEEKKKIAKELKSLADQMKSSDGELSKALAQALSEAAAGMESGDMSKAMEALDNAELSAADMQALAQQLQAMQGVQASLAQWQQGMMGPSQYCRQCGAKLKECKNGANCTGCGAGHSCSGTCGSCAGNGVGPGMGGPGRGAGGQVGNLPNPNVAFQPTKLQGGMTKGKILAGIMQKTTPDQDAQPTQDYVVKTFESVQQEAEQALTKEEIPPGAKEYVRQYFGNLEPEEAQQ